MLPAARQTARFQEDGLRPGLRVWVNQPGGGGGGSWLPGVVTAPVQDATGYWSVASAEDTSAAAAPRLLQVPHTALRHRQY
eukprot:SAG31_NODE_21393_length_550_cov_3.186253_1_plen_80_part_10